MDRPMLLAARPDELTAAALAYETLTTALQTRRDAWTKTVCDPLDDAWHGEAADRASRTTGALTGRLQAAQLELTAVRDVLREAAEAFTLARSTCEAATPSPSDGLTAGGPAPDGATAGHAGLGDPGSGGTGSGGAAPAGWAPDASTAERDALARAEEADRITAERLARLTESARSGQALSPRTGLADLQQLTDPATGTGTLLAGLLPAPGTSPERTAAWWRTLGPRGRDLLTADHPELIGNLDGLPAADRDRANRLALDHLLAHPEKLAAPQLKGLRAIHDRLARSDAHVLLLGLGTAGQGRAVLSYGDPDTADDVAVYVPGFGTELASVGGGDADRALRVHDGATRLGEGRTTAAMVWLGYDPPPNEGLHPGSAEVADDARARTGAEAYGRFLAGLRAARPGGPAHVTALGHSYGSLVVGLAARESGFGADEVVLVGSPGTEAAHAADLAVGADHVYVGAADYDPVTHLPTGPTAAGGWALGSALGVAAAAALPHELWFGQDPASDTFAAHRFAVDPGDPAHAFDSHSAYFDDPSESLTNIARIVADHPNDVTLQHGR